MTAEEMHNVLRAVWNRDISADDAFDYLNDQLRTELPSIGKVLDAADELFACLRVEKNRKMGEIADDMIEGRSCSRCGVYFVEAHGHPVICRNCFATEDETEEELADIGITRAYLKELGD